MFYIFVFLRKVKPIFRGVINFTPLPVFTCYLTWMSHRISHVLAPKLFIFAATFLER